jgi:hypothetical protein
MMLKMERARIEETRKKQEEEEAMTSRSKRLGEGDVQFDQERLARALKEERKRKADEGDEGKYGDKRRKYNSAMDVDVTEEDLGTLLSQTNLVLVLELIGICRGLSFESAGWHRRSNVQLQGLGDMTPFFD